MISSKIIPCSCKHEYQDKVYGVGNRLHNPLEFYGAKGGKPGGRNCDVKGYRCTVCSNVKGR